MKVHLPKFRFPQSICHLPVKVLPTVVTRVVLPIFAILAGLFAIRYWRSKATIDISDPKSNTYAGYLDQRECPPEDRVIEEPYMTIFVFKEDVELRPLYHLEALCSAIGKYFTDVRDYIIFAAYLEGELRSNLDPKSLNAADDRGGVFRDYLDVLVTGVIKRLSPYLAGAPHTYIPLAANLDDVAVQVFKNVGRLMMYCYHAADTTETSEGGIIISRLIGRHFDDAVFHCALILDAEDIDASDLSSQAKLEICRALVESRIETRGRLDWLAKQLDSIIENRPNLTSAQDIQAFLGSLGISTTNKVNKANIVEEAVCSAVQQATDIDPKKMFKPIHAIAQGMKEFCCPGKDPARRNDCWRYLTERVSPQSFSSKVQGALLTPYQRALIANSFVIDENCNDKIKKAVKSLQQWIVNPSTEEEEVRLFLKFTTGATAPISGCIFNILSVEGKGILPRVSTCVYTLTFPSEYPDGMTSETADQRFIEIFKEAMGVTVDTFDSI